MKIKHIEAGNCLRFGLENEIPESYDFDDSDSCYNLKAFCVYFIAIGYFSRKTIKALRNFRDSEFSDVSVEDLYKSASKCMIEDFHRHYDFANFDELIEKLNEITIPKWAFNHATEILESNSLPYCVDRNVFFIVQNVLFDRFDLVSCESREDNSDEEDDPIPFWMTSIFKDVKSISEKKISSIYSKIIACDKEKKILYLKPAKSNNVFTEYHIDSGEEILHPYECIGITADNYPIVGYGGDICIFDGSNFKPIGSYIPDCVYDITYDNMIEIYPSYSCGRVFKPYLLDMDGNCHEVDNVKVVDFCVSSMGIQLDTDFLFECRFPEKDKITLEAMKKWLSTVQKFSFSEPDMVNYRILVNHLSKILPDDKDITELLIRLADASASFNRKHNINYKNGDSFISEVLCFTIIKIDNSGEWNCLGENFDDIIYAIEKAAGLSDGENDTEYDLFNDIGTFSICNGKVTAIKLKKSEAALAGDCIFHKDVKMSNFVTLNISTGVHEIYTKQGLTKDDIIRIKGVFGIPENEVCRIIKNSP